MNETEALRRKYAEKLARHKRVAELIANSLVTEKDLMTLLRMCEEVMQRTNVLRVNLSYSEKLTLTEKVLLCLPKNITPEFAIRLGIRFNFKAEDLLFDHMRDLLEELV